MRVMVGEIFTHTRTSHGVRAIQAHPHGRRSMGRSLMKVNAENLDRVIHAAQQLPDRPQNVSALHAPVVTQPHGYWAWWNFTCPIS